MSEAETLEPPQPTPEESRRTAIVDAKRLMRISRNGALATLDASGAPLATLVGVVSDADGAPLFLLSDLARHTQNLARDARASLLLTTNERGRGDPLNQPRLTLGGPLVRTDSKTALERYLRRYPKAKLYAGFADFSLRRMEVEIVHFNGGFGRADRLTATDLLVGGDVAALAGAETELIEWVDSLGDAALAGLAGGRPEGRRVWRAAGVDAEGLELSAGSLVARVRFNEPAFDADHWRSRLTAAIASTPPSS